MYLPIVELNLDTVGVGQDRRPDPRTPGRVENIKVAVLGLLGHQLYLDPLPLQVGEAVRAENVAYRAGVVLSTIGEVEEGRSLRKAGIQPVGSLVVID
jgi:hypothetical protein